MDKREMKPFLFPAIVVLLFITAFVMMCVKGYQQDRNTEDTISALHREVLAQKNLIEIQHKQFEQILTQRDQDISDIQKQLEEAQKALTAWKEEHINFP